MDAVAAAGSKYRGILDGDMVKFCISVPRPLDDLPELTVPARCLERADADMAVLICFCGLELVAMDC